MNENAQDLSPQDVAPHQAPPDQAPRDQASRDKGSSAPTPSPVGRPRRALVEGSTLGLGVVLATILVAMVNYLASRHYARFDWTSSKVFTLSEKSQAVLDRVDRDIDAILFLVPNSPVDSQVFDQVSELLDRYEAANPRIRKRVIDPARDRLEVTRLIEDFDIERAHAVVIAAGDDRRVLDGFDFVEYDYSGASLGQPPSVKAFRGEQLITSAILELIEDEKPKVVFTSGHGEASIEATSEGSDPRALAAAADLLGRDNFALETWSSLGQATVPADSDLVVVAGPTDPFLPPEVETLSSYLDEGGRLLLLLDPMLQPDGALAPTGLESLLASRGLIMGPDLVIDPAQQLPVYGPETIFTASYGSHPIIEPLVGRPVILSVARSVRRSSSVPAGTEVSELILTSPQAWAETDLSTLPDVARDEDEAAGSLALGAAIAWPDRALPADDVADGLPAPNGDERQTRIVVLGDSDFATDEQLYQGANSELLLGSFNWLIEREALVAIAAREPQQMKLLLSASEVRTLYLLVLVVLPGAAIVAGIFVHVRRRR